MKIIEKLEALMARNLADACGEIEEVVSIDDLRAIIEEAKKQEPVAWKLTNPKAEYGVTYYDKYQVEGMLSRGWSVDKVLFTHPQLSDETVKDATRWNKLIGYVGASTAKTGDQYFHMAALPIPDGINLMQGSVAGHLTKIIDEAMKADNDKG